MCYEFRLFKSRAKKTQTSAQIESGVRRVGPNVQPIHPVREQDAQRRKEVKREFEEIL
jgi:hypothetical protein